MPARPARSDLGIFSAESRRLSGGTAFAVCEAGPAMLEIVESEKAATDQGAPRFTPAQARHQ
jgi:hypothetical protein